MSIRNHSMCGQQWQCWRTWVLLPMLAMAVDACHGSGCLPWQWMLAMAVDACHGSGCCLSRISALETHSGTVINGQPCKHHSKAALWVYDKTWKKKREKLHMISFGSSMYHLNWTCKLNLQMQIICKNIDCLLVLRFFELGGIQYIVGSEFSRAFHQYITHFLIQKNCNKQPKFPQKAICIWFIFPGFIIPQMWTSPLWPNSQGSTLCASKLCCQGRHQSTTQPPKGRRALLEVKSKLYMGYVSTMESWTS
jgi:hypothetical protein